MKLAFTNGPTPYATHPLTSLEGPPSSEAGEISRRGSRVESSLASLIARIVGHHAHTRSELERLRRLGSTLGGADVEVSGVRRTLDLLRELDSELRAHMAKEEAVVFPYIVSLETCVLAGWSPVRSPLGVLELPLKVMLDEQCRTRSLLASMRSVSSGFAAPCGASEALMVFFQGLEALEHDLSEHGRLETALLFPRALELEQRAQE